MACTQPPHPEPMTLEALISCLPHIRQSPTDDGVLGLIVRRPRGDAREVLAEGTLTPGEGLVGDNWCQRHDRHTSDGAPDPNTQLNLMNARVIEAIAGSVKRWPLAGDQLFVDFDLSPANLPTGTRLSIGDAVIEVTARPHTGCGKFAARFGADALAFVNSPEGRAQNRRGVNARVVIPGRIRTGDTVTKLSSIID